METIIVTENTKMALDSIKSARTPITVEFSIDSCNGHVIDFIAISSVLKKHPYLTIAKTRSCSSLLLFVGADKIVIEKDAFVFIKPLTMVAAGDLKEQKAAAKALKDLSSTVSKMLSKWPEAKKLFDGSGEHFLNATDLEKMGIGNQQA